MTRRNGGRGKGEARVKVDNRFRFVVSLLMTAVILCSGPFLWDRPAVVRADADPVVDETPAPVFTPAPVVTTSAAIAPAITPEPLPPEETLTAHQRYVAPIVAPGSTNLLICAPDPSAWNMDTIVIASFSETAGTLSLISLPRDIYVDYSDALEQTVASMIPGLMDEPGMRKINAAHAIGDKIHYKEGEGRFDRPYIEFLADVIEEIFDVHVDDYLYLQTRGFRRIVDYFGGVTLNVPIRMYYQDPFQDLSIDLQPGRQHLDGTQAEGFVRFRQGYNEEGVLVNHGDLFRKENQTRFLKAFIQQHMTLRNLTRLSDISDFIGKNVITSVRGWEEIVHYGALAETAVAEDYPIESVPLRMKDGRIDGLSYVLLEEVADPDDAPGSGAAPTDGSD